MSRAASMNDTPDILKKIVARKHEEIAARRAHVPRAALAARLADADAPRGFVTAMQTRVDAGSIEYSAVSQALPWPFIQCGTPSWATTVHSTDAAMAPWPCGVK